MAELQLFDSDVLIDYLRGQPDAVVFVQETEAERAASVITIAELYSGVHEGQERTRLENLIRALRTFPVSDQLAIEGGLIRREWYPSHGTGLADALIVATAEMHGATLVTLNDKHFPMLDDEHLIVPYRKPS